MDSKDPKIAQLENELAELRAKLAALTGNAEPTPKAAASERGAAIGGDVKNSFVITGDGNLVYQGEPPESEEQAEAIYRELIADRCGYLPLRAVTAAPGDRGAIGEPLSLARVYIALDTRCMTSADRLKKALQRAERGEPFELAEPRPDREREAEPVPLSALAAAVLHRRLVLLGDPGSGKSTFVNHLTHALTTRDWEPLQIWPQREQEALPIPIILRDFAAWVATPERRSYIPCAALLWEFVVHDLRRYRLEFAARRLEKALNEGRAVVLLDGLDEIPPDDESLLRLVRDSMLAFAARYKKSRYLVTCRVLSYQDDHWRLPDEQFPALELAPFDEDKIDRFIGAWYAEVADKWHLPPDDATRLAGKLRQAVRRKDLWRLAGNPLLLTVMALVHTHRKELPEKRALLYQDAVGILLERWEQEKEIDAPQIKDLLGDVDRDFNDLNGVLERLAFEAHEQGGASEEAAGIDELTLLKGLAALHPKQDLGWAQRLLETLRLRASLLLERKGRVFSFPHRTFQEYLAGVHLARQADFDRKAASLAGEGAFWREVILLAVGYLMHHLRDSSKPRCLIEELCPQRAPQNDRDWRKVWLAGEVLLEIGINRTEDTEHGKALVRRVRRRLTDLVEQGALPARERAETGDVLGQIGDPRFEPALFYLPKTFRNQPEPLAGFVEVPPGPFVMGSRKGDKDAYEDEFGNPETLRIDYRYWIARYPVTVAQYAAFVEAGGEEPWLWNEQRDYPNRPVMNVTWFQAMAYCRWLDARLRERRDIQLPLDQGYVVRLPTEAEWEKAARAGDDRRYPWGNEDWDEERANAEVSIGDPTPVGMYPKGATPAGLLDMSSNVWEWTLTMYRDYPYDPSDGRNDPESKGEPVLRGGSWGYDQRYARCAIRLRVGPRLFIVIIGFRAAVSLANSEF